MKWLLCILLLEYSICFLDYVTENGWGTYCFQEKKGSPINIISSLVDITSPLIGNLQIIYKTQFSGITRSVVEEEKFQLSYSNVADNYVLLTKNNTKYQFDITNIHYHCESEHHIDGYEYKCEMHLVHKRSSPLDQGDDKLYLVIGVFLDTKPGQAANPILSNSGSIDLSVLFYPNQYFYYYEGGLTTPPCTEKVNWLVMKDPVYVSEQQIKDLDSWIKDYVVKEPNNHHSEEPYDHTGNDRDVQVLGDRKVYMISSLSAKFIDFCSFILVCVMIAIN